MMRFQVLFLSIVAFQCVLGIREGRCKDIVVSGFNYEQDILLDGVDSSYQMTVDYDTNFLFFSFTGPDGFNTAAYIDLNTNEFGTIDGVRGGFATSFDANTRKVYIGARDGIYEFDYETKSGVKTNITDKNIWQIFSKGDVYFTTFPDEQAFVYRNEELNQVEGIGNQNVIQVSVDAENNVFFYNSTGLYSYEQITGKTFYLGDVVVIGFTTDLNGDLYFCTPTGVFKVKNVSQIKKLSRIVGIFGMAMGMDGNIIYSTNNQIIRLQPIGTECVPELMIL